VKCIKTSIRPITFKKSSSACSLSNEKLLKMLFLFQRFYTKIHNTFGISFHYLFLQSFYLNKKKSDHFLKFLECLIPPPKPYHKIIECRIFLQDPYLIQLLMYLPSFLITNHTTSYLPFCCMFIFMSINSTTTMFWLHDSHYESHLIFNDRCMYIPTTLKISTCCCYSCRFTLQ
jgi:hypothetical protein